MYFVSFSISIYVDLSDNLKTFSLPCPFTFLLYCTFKDVVGMPIDSNKDMDMQNFSKGIYLHSYTQSHNCYAQTAPLNCYFVPFQ